MPAGPDGDGHRRAPSSSAKPASIVTAPPGAGTALTPIVGSIASEYPGWEAAQVGLKARYKRLHADPISSIEMDSIEECRG